LPRVAVIGKGLFGSATARHLARRGINTVIVGPDEPVDVAEHAGPFGAHYDEARILVARGDAASVALTQLTIDGIAELEAAVGEELIVRSGGLEIGPSGGAVRQLVDEIVAVPVGAARLDEPPPQGYFNPRRYIRAALGDAAAHGAAIVRTPVAGLGHSAGKFVLDCGDQEVVVDRVVVAAGAWSNRLLRRRVALRLKQESVLFAQLDESVASAITMRPTVFHGRTGKVEDIYTLPPIRYPDGRWYLKLGANTVHDRSADPRSVDDWYRAGGSGAQADLEEAFAVVFPEVTPRAFHLERCVITYTPNGRPFIAKLGVPGLYIAAAGNGHGASWADGAGELAARMVNGEAWPSEGDGRLNAADFAVTYEDESPTWPTPLLLADRLG